MPNCCILQSHIHTLYCQGCMLFCEPINTAAWLQLERLPVAAKWTHKNLAQCASAVPSLGNRRLNIWTLRTNQIVHPIFDALLPFVVALPLGVLCYIGDVVARVVQQGRLAASVAIVWGTSHKWKKFFGAVKTCALSTLERTSKGVVAKAWTTARGRMLSESSMIAA